MEIINTKPFETLDAAWKYVISHHERDLYGVHGPLHWATVERNGLYLAEHTGANPVVVSLFALFHDSRRLNDHHDPEHGPRGSVYALLLWNALYELFDDPDDFDLLIEACNGHTHIHHHDNPTIATCWDADRLDLGRVDVIPHPSFLNGAEAKKIATSGNFSVLSQFPTRNVQPFFQK